MKVSSNASPMRQRSVRLTLFSKRDMVGFRLAGLIVSRHGQSIAGGLRTRIYTQVVAVTGVPVAAGDLEHALPDEVGSRLVDIALMSVIRQLLYDSVHDAYLGFGLPEQQNAAVDSLHAAVKIGLDFPARNACKGERLLRNFPSRCPLSWLLFVRTLT